MMVESLSKYGKSFATRPRGSEVAVALAGAARANGASDLTVSFHGVSVIAGSFADEFVRRLIAEAGVGQISFSEMNPAVEARIRWAVEHSRKISGHREGAGRLPELVA